MLEQLESLASPLFLRNQTEEGNWNRINWESQGVGHCLMTRMGNACLSWLWVTKLSPCQNVLRPYPNRNPRVQQQIYNYRLTRARRMVECAFGILANKWKIFHRPLDVTPQFCDSIVKACCILHSFFAETMRFSWKILCTKVILKAFELQGQEETSKESMWETILPSILRHHTELCLGSTIKYDLESDIPWKSIDLC